MDKLPSLLQVKIFSYLPGEDVSRFSQLGSAFRELIKRNRNYLKKPLIAVEIYSKKGNPNKDVTVLVYAKYKKYDKYHYRFYPKQKNLLTDRYIEPWDYCHQFFSNFYTRDVSEQSLCSYIDFMLERADIDELSVDSLLNATWLHQLSESIQASSCRIYSVLISPFTAHFPQVASLLEAISEQKQKEQVKPHLRIGSFDLNQERAQTILDVHKLNEISSRFHSARFEVLWVHTSELIHTIAKQWEFNPIAKFFFDIQCCTSRRYENDFDDYFEDFSREFQGEATLNNKEYFLRLSPTDEPSSFCLLKRERESKQTLQFTKKNGLTDPDYPIFDLSVSDSVTVDISIETFQEK